MFYKILIAFFLLTLPCFAGYEVVSPETVGTLDEWSNVGGADKITSLTDADDATYIQSAAASVDDTQEVNIADLTVAEGADVIDSVRWVYLARSYGTLPTVTMRGSIMIGTDVLNGTTRSLSSIITTYTESFTTPPGSRGTWDIVEVDSLVGRFAVLTATVGDGARIMKSYVEVFYTSASRTIYQIEGSNGGIVCTDDLYNDALYDFDLAQDTFAIAVPANSTNQTMLWVSDGVHPNEWPTSGFSVRFKVIRFTNTPNLQVYIRMDTAAGCVHIDSTGYFPSAGNLTIDSTGNYVINVASKDWPTSPGVVTFFTVVFAFDNGVADPVDSVYIETGDTTSAVYSEIASLSAPQGTGSGSTSFSSGTIAGFNALCSNVEDSTASTSAVQLLFSGAGANKIAGTEFESGQEHIFFYDMSLGGIGSSTECSVGVRIGTTMIAEGDYECSGSGNPVSARGGYLSGFWVQDGSGAVADSFFAVFKTSFTSAWVGGMCLMALNMNNLTYGTHWWYKIQNGQSAVKTVTSTTDSTILIDTTFTIPEAGYYLVLASAEGWGGGATGDQGSFHFELDDTRQKGKQIVEWEDGSDRFSFCYARLHDLTAASHKFEIQVGRVASTDTWSFRRGRVIIVRANAYAQLFSATNDNLDSVQTLYSTWANHDAASGTDLAGIVITPTASAPILAISNTWGTMGRPAAGGELGYYTRLRNDSTAAIWSDASVYMPRSTTAVDTVDGRDSLRGGFVTSLGFRGDSTQTTAWSLQTSANFATLNNNEPVIKAADLILWELTEDVSAPPASSPKRRRKLLQIGQEEVRPIEYVKTVLGLPPKCDCEEK